MTKVKICGLFRSEDIAVANECRPDYIGFVFAPSRRQVTPELARHLRSLLDDSILAVGVFVDEPVENIVALVGDGTIDLVQLHGSETAASIARLKQAADVPVIKALAMGKGLSEHGWSDSHLAEYQQADYLLFDSAHAGSGIRFDWQQLPGLSGSGFAGLAQPCFLAGGINCATLAEALSLEPFAVDISSGAETAGYKDRSKMHYLVQQVRSQ